MTRDNPFCQSCKRECTSGCFFVSAMERAGGTACELCPDAGSCEQLCPPVEFAAKIKDNGGMVGCRPDSAKMALASEGFNRKYAETQEMLAELREQYGHKSIGNIRDIHVRALACLQTSGLFTFGEIVTVTNVHRTTVKRRLDRWKDGKE